MTAVHTTITVHIEHDAELDARRLGPDGDRFVALDVGSDVSLLVIPAEGQTPKQAALSLLATWAELVNERIDDEDGA